MIILSLILVGMGFFLFTIAIGSRCMGDELMFYLAMVLLFLGGVSVFCDILVYFSILPDPILTLNNLSQTNFGG